MSVESDSVEMFVLTCPRDGNILGDHCEIGDGYYECQQCRTNYPVWRLIQ